MVRTAYFVVTGAEIIHCESCEQRITNALRRLQGVEDVTASHQTPQVTVTFDPNRVGTEGIRTKLAQTGFEAKLQEGASA
ncbi:MAG: heavy-metal-associated domain-containing protein [Chloroflexi bacterium]|nr:heavy-metal-associated domain-containing protein [Chloroflexota bacterium]